MTDYSNIVLKRSDTISKERLAESVRGMHSMSITAASWSHNKKQITLYGTGTIKSTGVGEDIADTVIHSIIHECIHGVIDDIINININKYDVHFPFACGIANDLEDVDLGYYWNHWEYYKRFNIIKILSNGHFE